MAKVILRPLGSALTQNAKPDERYVALCHNLEAKRAEIKLGWGKTYQDRIQKKGKMTAWQRVEYLADANQFVMPIGTFVNDGEIFQGEGAGRTSPSAGVVTAFVRVHGRWCMVIANDNTVASGSWWPKTPEKIIRAQEIALKLKLPVLYLVDCSGLFLPEQGKTFPGKYGAGKIFKMNSLLSDAGVPQIAGVFGDCIAGGGYMPIISDKVFMTEQAYMVIAGAALIQGAKSQNLSSLDIGGANVHVHISNCADARVPNDETCLAKIKNEVSLLSSSAVSYYRHDAEPSEPKWSSDEIDAILPANPKVGYDIRQVISRLVDDSLFWELLPEIGQEVVVGIAKISGLYVGIAANVQELVPHPEHSGKKRPGGILYREGVAKLAMFSRACESDGIPLIWLQDVSGFDVGTEAEKQGLLGYGSSLIYANSTNQIPMTTVLLRKASGAGYYAMAGMPYDPVLQLSTPLSRLAVMEGKTLAIGAFNTKLDDNFQITTSDEKEREQILSGMKLVEERIEADMNPLRSAKQMDTDEIVKLSEIRNYLICITEASYQTQGVRRIKNSRIWSLHDLQVFSNASRIIPENHESIKAGDSQTVYSHQEKSKNVLKCTMDGLFYRRVSPLEPAFVEVGQMLQPGQTIGLIEVMKCFYPVIYEGNSVRCVKTITVEDAAAVSVGDVLLIFEE